MQGLFDGQNSIVDDPDLAEQMTAFAESAVSLLEDLSPLERIREWREKSPRFDRALWASVSEAGWPALLVPEEKGGLGLDTAQASAILGEVGRHPLPEPVLAGIGHAPAILRKLPDSDLSNELMEKIASGEILAGVAWQEPAQSDEFGGLPETSAIVDGETITLNGSKTWAAPGRGADGWIVSATIGGELGLYWVPVASLHDSAVKDMARVDGSSMATVTLANVSIPVSNCLATGDTARDALNKGNDILRILQSAELLGIAQQSFDLTLEYLNTRVQFGQPIGANQALQHRMVDGLIYLRLARAALGEALGVDESTLSAAASRAKARCAQVALHLTRLAVQFHGAFGYTDECDIGFYYKRALQLNSWMGTASEHRLRHLANGSQQEASADPSDKKVEVTEIAKGDADWSQYSDDEFRAMVRKFLEDNYPEEKRYPSTRLHWPEIKDWYMTLSRQGWLAPGWPREHGGMALPPEKMLAFIEEMEDYGAARMPDQGIINLGPILIQCGSAEQKAYYLPKILAGEHIWCQGYSEPNAGSDLASLRTEAVLDGDEFVVNGQKIWSTLAQDATHTFLLVRTNKNVKKQAGISFLLVELNTPGVTVRPIRNIAGEEEFCEIFFDNVRVPKENLVGEIDQGWTIAKALLGWERLFVGSPKTSQYALAKLRKAARARGLMEDKGFRSKLAELSLDVADLSSCYAYYAEFLKKGEPIPASVSILKIWATETYSRIASQLVEICAEDGAALNTGSENHDAVDALSVLMNSAVTTIYGGTNEIQRNILARHVLNMPRTK